MKRWLNEIVEIEGVEGVIITNNNGRIIEKLGANIDPGKLERIALPILRIFSAYYLKKRNVRELELIWNDYRIINLNTNDFIIITFCASLKALSLIRITLNVVLAHLLEDKKFMKKIKKHASEKTAVLSKGNLDQSEINLISKLQ